MYDPIYEGWGNRTWLKGLLKGSVANARLRRDAEKFEPTVRSVSEELRRLNLDRDEGIDRLAEMVAENILTSFDEQVSDVGKLSFCHHLRNNIAQFFRYEKLFHMPEGLGGSDASKRSELWQSEAKLQRIYHLLSNFDQAIGDIAQMYRWFVSPLVEQFPQLLDSSPLSKGQLSFEVDAGSMMQDLPQAIERMVTLPFAPEFDELKHTNHIRERLEYNVVLASGGMPGDPDALRKAKLPTQLHGKSGDELLSLYLEGTPFAMLFDIKVSISIPDSVRFEHHHLVAGSGHGKTQTIQQLILHDLATVIQGNASIVVLDSQGDLINTISNLAIFRPDSPLFDRLVIVDPTDVEYPVALNLFDVKMDRINQYSQLERERMINGILELYDFVLGSLLAAEMTQKQSVIFRYITRLMLHIPNATILTLRDLLEEGGADKYREHINKLEGSARSFFESEFDSKEFAQTKKQVLRRLWGILENQSFERMFLHPRNKLDLFTEMNSGKVILINTAKDLLKDEGTQMFGRFFIAMIAQAAQERSVIPQHERMPTYVYIDEAADYFDRNIRIILEQARKYKVGMILAHQFMGQMDSKLQEAVLANTSLRFAGGVSTKDARLLASEMRTPAEFIEVQPKLSLAAYVRGISRSAFPITVKPGQMESLATLTEEQKTVQRNHMRQTYCVHYSEAQRTREETEGPVENSDADTSSVSSVSSDDAEKAPLSGQNLSDEPDQW